MISVSVSYYKIGAVPWHESPGSPSNPPRFERSGRGAFGGSNGAAAAAWAKYISLDRIRARSRPGETRPLAPFGGIGSQSHNTIAAMFHDGDGNTVIKNGFKFKEKEEEREDIE